MIVTMRMAAAGFACGVVLLAGCRDAEPPAPAPTASAEPPIITVPTATASSSIIRPDVGKEPEAEPVPDPLRLTIRFPEGSRLPHNAAGELQQVLSSEALAAGWPILVTGHSDSDGNDRANIATSRRRAEAVAGWLTDNGVDPARIRVVALGEQNPVAPNARPDGSPDENGRARNRRVELEIAPPEGTAPSAEDERTPSALEKLATD
jgi:OmpA-OmpF porin, OOP family